MRAPWLLTALVLSLPAAAAGNHTRTVPLRYLSAVEAEGFLLHSHSPLPQAAVRKIKDLDELELFPGGPGNLIPDGITALTADTRRNALVFSGDAESIEQVTRILRLFDIPPRSMRLSVRLVRIEPAALKELAPPVQGSIQVAALDEKQVQALGIQPTQVVSESSLDGNNHRPFRIFLPAAAKLGTGQAVLTPRINGDGTLTVSLALPQFPGGQPTGTVVSARRFLSGATVLISPVPGLAFLVRPEILPEPLGAER